MAFREFIYPSWVRLTRLDRNVRRKSSDRGRLLGTATFICGAVGLDTDLSYVYQLFALLLCLLIAARISLKFHTPDVSVRRQLPRYATVDQPFDYHISVINDGNRVERDLKIMDNPKVVPPEFAEFRARKEPGEDTRNAYDRWIGFHRFVWLQKLKTGITIKTAEVPDVDLKSHAEATLTATPLRRGSVSFQSTTILHPDPFGIYYGIQEFDTREQLIVLPKRYPIARTFQFQGGRHFQPGGINSTWSIGESDEFVSLRDYRDGDPIRKIHWASTAKRDKPVVKEFQDEFFVRQGVVVDCFDQGLDLFEDTIAVAASLLTALRNQDGLTDLMFMTDRPEVITAGRGYAQTSQQLEALAMLPLSPKSPVDFTPLLDERARLMSGCVFVLGNLDEERQKWVKLVEARGVQTAILVLTEQPDVKLTRADCHLIDVNDIEGSLARL